MTFRIRESGGFSPVQSCAYSWQSNKTKPPIQWVDLVDAVGTFEHMEDHEIPQFHRRSREGEVFMNDMRHSKETRQYVQTGPEFTYPGTITYHADLLGYGWGRYPTVQLFADKWESFYPTELQIEASAAALASVGRSDFSGLVTLGELGETISLLKNPFFNANKIANTASNTILALTTGKNTALYKSLSKASQALGIPNPGAVNPRRYAQLVQRNKKYLTQQQLVLATQLSQVYLGIRYAYRPLIKEIDGILSASLLAGRWKRSERETYRSSRSYNGSAKWSLSETIGGYSVYTTYEGTLEFETRVGFLYQRDLDILMKDFYERFGFRGSDIPIAVWDLLPLSFMVGWFLNVADVLAAYTPVANYRQLTNFCTSTWKYSLASYSRNWTSPYGGVRTRDGGGENVVTYEYKERKFAPLPRLILKQNASTVLSDPLRLIDIALIGIQRLANVLPGGISGLKNPR